MSVAVLETHSADDSDIAVTVNFVCATGRPASMLMLYSLDSIQVGFHAARVRTTVTLDPDVEHLVKDAVRKTGASFNEVLNRAVRSGLSGQTDASVGKPFRVRARRLGLRAGIDAGSLNRLADDFEVEEFVGPRKARR